MWWQSCACGTSHTAVHRTVSQRGAPHRHCIACHARDRQHGGIHMHAIMQVLCSRLAILPRSSHYATRACRLESEDYTACASAGRAHVVGTCMYRARACSLPAFMLNLTSSCPVAPFWCVPQGAAVMAPPCASRGLLRLVLMILLAAPAAFREANATAGARIPAPPMFPSTCMHARESITQA